MKCWKCGTENSEYVTFCENCSSILNQGPQAEPAPQAEPSAQADSATTGVNEDLQLFTEFEAVRELVQKAQVAYVMRASTRNMEANRFMSEELLQILQEEGDKRKIYLLDNGPKGSEPGVYLLNEAGEILPYPLYVPMEFNGRSMQISKKPFIL